MISKQFLCAGPSHKRRKYHDPIKNSPLYKSTIPAHDFFATYCACGEVIFIVMNVVYNFISRYVFDFLRSSVNISQICYFILIYFCVFNCVDKFWTVLNAWLLLGISSITFTSSVFRLLQSFIAAKLYYSFIMKERIQGEIKNAIHHVLHTM